MKRSSKIKAEKQSLTLPNIIVNNLVERDPSGRCGAEGWVEGRGGLWGGGRGSGGCVIGSRGVCGGKRTIGWGTGGE